MLLILLLLLGFGSNVFGLLIVFLFGGLLIGFLQVGSLFSLFCCCFFSPFSHIMKPIKKIIISRGKSRMAKALFFLKVIKVHE